VPESWDEGIIREIASLGHEVGYHYENLTTCGGDFRLAIDDFRSNLEKLRKIYPVKPICMHGSPLSKINNLDLWKKYDYKELGIIAEPYLDIDFDEIFYLTDTGRRWDGDAVSVRDKVKAQSSKGRGHSTNAKPQLWPKFHSTFEIIAAVEAGRFPEKAIPVKYPPVKQRK
jgi:hypothetical protein